MAIINAQVRDGAGKGVARRLRREGRVPAVLYGAGQPNINLSLDSKAWRALLSREQSSLRTHRQDMVIGENRREPVLMRSFQTHPLSGDTLHIDFTRFDPTQKVELFIPVHVTGEEVCPGIKEGGILQVIRHELEVSCLARDVPDSIKISVESLQMGNSIHINDIQLPPGVEVHTEVNFTVLAIIAVKAEAVAEEGENVVEEGTPETKE